MDSKFTNPPISEDILKLGDLIDEADIKQDILLNESALEFGRSIDVSNRSAHEQGWYYYLMSNGVSQQENFNGQANRSLASYQNDIRKEKIFLLRKAIMFEQSLIEAKISSAPIYTNLASTLSSCGRWIEAIEYFMKVIEVRRFPMAECNLALCLQYVGGLFYEEDSTNSYQYVARYFFEKALNNREELVPEIIGVIISERDRLGEFSNYDEYFQRVEIHKEHHINEISNYQQWCITQVLFLDHNNDLRKWGTSGNDIIQPPFFTYPKEVMMSAIRCWNDLISTYSLARLSLYEATNPVSEGSPNFSAIWSFNDTSDNYLNIASERLKQSFRLAYSCFDKVAGIINLTNTLGVKPHQTYLKKIWYSDYSKKSLKENLPLNPSLWALKWLSDDLFDLDEKYTEVLEPEAKSIAECRNAIEHKAIVLHDGDLPNEISYYDGIYFISYNDLVNKSFKTLRLARAAIMYLKTHIDQQYNYQVYLRNKKQPS